MPDYTPSPQWTTGVEVDRPVPIKKRTGEPALRHELPYESGKVWAVDTNRVRAGYQSFDVYPELKVVLLVQAGMDAHDGDNGTDNRRQGGARAMLDELDRLYPEPEWWMASANAGHVQEGIELMRGRRGNSRRKVHTEECAVARPSVCACDFRDARESEQAD